MRPFLALLGLITASAVVGQIPFPGPGVFYTPTATVYTPTVIQWSSGSSTKSNAAGTTVNTCPTHDNCFSLPNGAQAGNAIVTAYSYSDSPSATPTCADDKGDTCTVIATADDTNNGTKLAIGRILNATAGARLITWANGAAVTKMMPWAMEVNNVSTTSADDGHIVGTSASGSSTVTAGTSGTGVFAGSGTANDLIVQCVIRSQTPQTTGFTAGSQTGVTSWSLLGTDLLDGQACQWGQYTLTSALSPAFTMATNSGYATVAIALKTASAGAARPAGMSVIGIQHEDVTNTIAGTSPIPLQFTCSGNLLVASAVLGGGATYTLTGITDGGSNSWAQSGSAIGDPTISGRQQLFYAPATGTLTCSAGMTVSVAATGTGDAAKDGSILLYDVTGAAASAYSQEAPNASLTDNAATGTTTLWNTVGPATSNGMAFINIGNQSNTASSWPNPSGALLDSQLFGGENVSGGGTHPPDEENGFGHYTFSTCNAQQWQQGYSGANTNVESYKVVWFSSATGTKCAGGIDSFTATNRDPITNLEWGTGSPWSTGSYKIASNKATPESLAVDSQAIYLAVVPANDQWAQVTLSALTGTSDQSGPGLILRSSGSAQTYYRIVVNASTSGNNTCIARINAGSYTLLSDTNYSGHWAAASVLYAQVSGSGTSSTVVIKKGGPGGTTVVTYVDNSASAINSGYTGIAYSSTLTAATLTTWSSGPL